MSIDEQVKAYADAIIRDSAEVTRGCNDAKAMKDTTASIMKRVTLALGRIKETTIRAQRDGIKDLVAVELQARGFGKSAADAA